MQNKITVCSQDDIHNRLTEEMDLIQLEYDLNKKDIFEINLVLDELCTNITEYNPNINITIEISVTCYSDRVIVTIEDDGKIFDPTLFPAPDTKLALSERPVGGLGIYFVKHYTNSIRYQRAGPKNVVVFTKKLKTRQI